ncbi:MAG TPA: cytidine deaminase [Pseudidiomarina sp.]|nr:cytidine deaminase [Pseudidiomarina sp.]
MSKQSSAVSRTALEQAQSQAKQAAERAHAPYSKFPVGAVLQFSTGDLVLGCNVENASYGLTNCAERTAVYSALAQGKELTDVERIVIYTPGNTVYSPCGACRQVLAEFLGLDTPFISTCDSGEKQWTLGELLPSAFSTFEATADKIGS